MSLAVATYYNLRPEPPEIAYADLDPAQQSRITELLVLGDRFFAGGVYQSAFESYVRAYLISEREPQTVERLEDFFERLTTQDDIPLNSAENLYCKIDCMQTNFDFFERNSALQTAGARVRDAVGQNPPRCGPCADYRKTYRPAVP
jgi:hypothetical protein